ncbi:MAG TPA: ethanolamine ammonia-lyase subunit EutC [Gemmatimonadales bacterium]|nr:ethanolamine ammonia-lyase subunit EutC [Gemmatimonadales bacterium]
MEAVPSRHPRRPAPRFLRGAARLSTPALPDPWAPLRALTPARIALGRAGTSLPTAAHLEFQLAHARARDAVHHALDVPALRDALERAGLPSLAVRSRAADRATFLQRPDLGRRLDPESRDRLTAVAAAGDPGADAVIVVGDGLAAAAAQRHAAPVVAALVPLLRDAGWRLAPVVVAEQARVALADEVGALLDARMALILLGERPGLTAPDSLGAYLTWEPRRGRTDAERNCVSNIRPDGLPYARAAERLHYLMIEARRRRITGVALKEESGMLGA